MRPVFSFVYFIRLKGHSAELNGLGSPEAKLEAFEHIFLAGLEPIAVVGEWYCCGYLG